TAQKQRRTFPASLQPSMRPRRRCTRRLDTSATRMATFAAAPSSARPRTPPASLRRHTDLLVPPPPAL
ncbi:hypothetical protein MNEG_2439, partial [Monoraphidium neglectum]